MLNLEKQKQDKFLNYIKDYIVFLNEMIDIQKRQLDTIVTTSVKDAEKIKEVDRSVVEVQGYVVRMDAMEKKRIVIQSEVGYNDMTFSQIIDSLEGVKKQEYSIVLENFKKCVENVTFYSKKIHEKVQSDLSIYNSVINQPASYNSSKQQLEVNRFGGSLQIKT